MTMTDPVADLLTRIRNMNRLKRRRVTIPYSKLKEQILETMLREGFITEFKVDGEGTARQLMVTLKYGPAGEHVINTLKRVSRPGRRVYRGVQELRPVLKGMGIHVMSTNKGILSDREARAQKVGGEILCEIC